MARSDQRGMAHTSDLIATDIEETDGVFTGKPRGTPTFREGKIERVNEWLGGQGGSLGDFESWFYSDSRNDIPLLSKVTHPVAVNPDTVLAALAAEKCWPVIEIR